MSGRGKRALRLTRDHKPSVAGESERIRGAGGEVNQQCALLFPAGLITEALPACVMGACRLVEALQTLS